MSDPTNRRNDDFAERLTVRMHAATADITSSSSLGSEVEGRARVRGRRAARMRIGALASVTVLTVGGIAWARSGSSRTPASPVAGVGPAVSAASSGNPPTVPVSEPAITVATVNTTPETFPTASPSAVNILVVGADNNACPNDGDPSSGSFGDRTQLGQRSDTIMIIRIDPSTSRVAVLSFPRDLWVRIAGTDKSSRINSAFKMDDPQRLIDTIALNFSIPIDHYVQLDFCGFKQIVDAVGGIAVPFEYPARDANSGLDVPTVGCFTFDGDAALSYVRSRHYEYLDPSTNEYREDPAGDYGRIARQQDLLRRLALQVIAQGFSPSVARELIGAATEYVVTDPTLTVGKMLELAGALDGITGSAIASYRVEGIGTSISGNAVVEPVVDSEKMVEILQLFRGQAAMPVPAQPELIEPSDPISSDDATSATAPTAAIDQEVRGIVPPTDTTC